MVDAIKSQKLSIAEKQKQIIAEFAEVSDWEERYKKLIAWGKALPALSDELKTEESKVKGCQSQVWLHAKLNEEGNLILLGDSDALIVRGLVALLLKLYSEESPQDILSTQPLFINEIGFEKNLSPSRTNGLVSMIRQIHNFAKAFLYLQSLQKIQK